MTSYKGQVRLVNQPDIFKPLYAGNPLIGSWETQPPKLQQYDGQNWRDVEIVENDK